MEGTLKTFESCEVKDGELLEGRLLEPTEFVEEENPVTVIDETTVNPAG